MTTQLPERLRDLAEDAPGPLAPGGLWREGRRRHRRRIVSAVAVAACLLAGTAMVGVGTWHSSQPGPSSPPATGTGAMQIPDRLYNPSPWTPSTRTPGRLVATFTATRDHFPFGSDRNALVGVAAGSQTYRFVDLPGQSSQATDTQLSPDGRHIAYWIDPPAGGPPTNPGALAGVAVLDVTTGKVEKHEVNTPYGLAVQSLTWLGPDALAMVAGRFASLQPMDFSGRDRTYLFSLGDTSGYSSLAPAVVQPIPVTTWPASGCPPTCPGLFAQMVAKRVLRVFHADLSSTISDLRFSMPARTVAFDARHHLVAATEGNPQAGGPTSGPLVVGRTDHGRVRFATVPGGLRYDQVMAWVDAAHVTTLRQTRSGIVYDLVDVRTGSRRQLTSKPWYGFTLAQEALQQPVTVHGIAPPTPWNPRWVALGALLVLAAGGTTFTLAARRRRAQR